MWAVVRARVESNASPHDAAFLLRCRHDQRYSGQLARKLRLRMHTRVRTKIPPRKCPLSKENGRGKKEFAGKRQKKKTSIGRTIPCALALFGDCVPYEARATKHSTADVAYETATGRAPSCVSRNRRTQVSRVASRDSLLFAKSKKKSAVVDERARDLRSTPHRSARASGGDARVDPTTRARAPRVAAKAGRGWPSTRGRASRDTILGRADACLRVFF